MATVSRSRAPRAALQTRKFNHQPTPTVTDAVTPNARLQQLIEEQQRQQSATRGVDLQQWIKERRERRARRTSTGQQARETTVRQPTPIVTHAQINPWITIHFFFGNALLRTFHIQTRAGLLIKELREKIAMQEKVPDRYILFRPSTGDGSGYVRLDDSTSYVSPGQILTASI